MKKINLSPWSYLGLALMVVGFIGFIYDWGMGISRWVLIATGFFLFSLEFEKNKIQFTKFFKRIFLGGFMDPEEAYLLGLMCGRGHILKKDNKIFIEFAHKNKVITGIAHCESCGCLATSNSNNEFLTCKSCGKQVSKNVKREYEQRESMVISLKENIIPFLSKKYKTTFDIIGNDHMTLLVIKFEEGDKDFNKIIGFFHPYTAYNSFLIPKEISNESEKCKIEFITGLLDTAGFFNAGGWFESNNERGKYIMRGYFQIVGNWKMPVLIMDFLYYNFAIRLQTIDWGHPNMRDQANIYAWGREHQVKFYPDEFVKFNLRINHKKLMFDELKSHNSNLGTFTKEYIEVRKIAKRGVSPDHPGENDDRLPVELKGKHYNKSWQIAYDLGSKHIKEIIDKANNKELFFKTGQEENENYFKELEEKRIEKTKEIEEQRKKVEEKMKIKEEKIQRSIRTDPEKQLYEPIRNFLETYFKNKFNERCVVYDTSSHYLDNFIIKNNLYEKFESYDGLKIKPDLVGFLLKSKDMLIVEVKISNLTLKNLGQLKNYCLIAQPKYAILISKEEPSITLKTILAINKGILNYSQDNSIKIAIWKDNKLNFYEEQ